MNRYRSIVATVVSFGLAMAPLTVFAEDEPATGAAGPTTDVVPVALWTIAGVLILGAMYRGCGI